MIRLFLPLATAAAVYSLANALASHDWLIAASAGVLVVAGIRFLTPGAVAHPVPADTATVNVSATGGEGR